MMQKYDKVHVGLVVGSQIKEQLLYQVCNIVMLMSLKSYAKFYAQKKMDHLMAMKYNKQKNESTTNNPMDTFWEWYWNDRKEKIKQSQPLLQQIIKEYTSLQKFREKNTTKKAMQQLNDKFPIEKSVKSFHAVLLKIYSMIVLH